MGDNFEYSTLNHCLFQESCNTASFVIELLQSLMGPIEKHCLQTSAVGATSRAQTALQELHVNDKNIESTDQLMVRILPYSNCSTL